MNIIGHRGAAGLEPENTLRSFKRAIELGVDMIECDVRLCRTGELVVIHDPTLDRTTSGQGAVSEKSLSELTDLDAGQGDHVLTLPEVFRIIPANVSLNIELKASGTATPTADLIKKIYC